MSMVHGVAPNIVRAFDKYSRNEDGILHKHGKYLTGEDAVIGARTFTSEVSLDADHTGDPLEVKFFGARSDQSIIVRSEGGLGAEANDDSVMYGLVGFALRFVDEKEYAEANVGDKVKIIAALMNAEIQPKIGSQLLTAIRGWEAYCRGASDDDDRQRDNAYLLPGAQPYGPQKTFKASIFVPLTGVSVVNPPVNPTIALDVITLEAKR